MFRNTNERNKRAQTQTITGFRLSERRPKTQTNVHKCEQTQTNANKCKIRELHPFLEHALFASQYRGHSRPTLGDEKLTQTLFSQTFRAPLQYPNSNPGKKFGFPGFRWTHRIFWPPSLHVEDPHPTRRHLDQKVRVWVLFSSPKCL